MTKQADFTIESTTEVPSGEQLIRKRLDSALRVVDEVLSDGTGFDYSTEAITMVDVAIQKLRLNAANQVINSCVSYDKMASDRKVSERNNASIGSLTSEQVSLLKSTLMEMMANSSTAVMRAIS